MGSSLPTHKGTELIAVFTTMLVLTTIVFALRVYVRLRLIKLKRPWEDWTATIGWLGFIVFCASLMAATSYGVGQHARLIPPERVPTALKV